MNTIESQFSTKESTFNFIPTIKKYQYHGTSPYLIDKFVIIGYSVLDYEKSILSSLKTPLTQKTQPGQFFFPSNGISFQIEIEPTIISEISSNYDKTVLENDTIIELVYPNKPIGYFFENKKAYASDKGENLPQSQTIVFNSNPSTNEGLKMSFNGLAHCFYEKYKTESGHYYLFPKAFVVVSEYPYYSSFYQMMSKIKYLFNTDSLEIPLEIVLYNLINYTPSPLNATIELDFWSNVCKLPKPEINLRQSAGFLTRRSLDKLIIQKPSLNDNKEPIVFPKLTGYPLIQINLHRLVGFLSPQIVLKLFVFSLLEKDIMIFSSNLELISTTIFAFLSLNYPLNEGNYYWINASVSLSNLENQSSVFASYSFPTILGVHSPYTNSYDYSFIGKKDHFILDLDNKNFEYMYKEETEEVKNINIIIEMIKNVIRDKSIAGLNSTWIYPAMRKLYAKIEKLDKKKMSYSGMYPKLFENVDENENQKIQEMFYQFILQCISALYKNITLHSATELGNDSDRKRINETFYNEYNYNIERNTKPEERLFFELFRTTFKFSSFVEGFIKSHSNYGLYHIPFTFMDELANFSAKQEGTKFEFNALEMIKNYYHDNKRESKLNNSTTTYDKKSVSPMKHKDNTNKLRSSLALHLNNGPLSSRDDLKKSMNFGMSVRLNTSSNNEKPVISLEKQVPKLKVSYTTFNDNFKHKTLGDYFHNVISSLYDTSDTPNLDKDIYKYECKSLDHQIIQTYVHLVKDFQEQFLHQIFPHYKQIKLQDVKHTQSTFMYEFESLIEEEYLYSKKVSMEYYLLYSLFLIFTETRALCNEKEFVDQMMQFSSVMDTNICSSRKYFKELFYVLEHLHSQKNIESNIKNAVGFCIFFMINKIRLKEMVSNETLTHLINFLNKENSSINFSGLQAEFQDPSYKMGFRCNNYKDKFIKEKDYIEFAKKNIDLYGLITNEGQVAQKFTGNSKISTAEDIQERMLYPRILFEIESKDTHVKMSNTTTFIFTPRKIFENLTGFKNKLLYDIKDEKRSEYNGYIDTPLSHYVVNLIFYVKHADIFMIDKKTNITSLLLKIYTMVERAQKPNNS